MERAVGKNEKLKSFKLESLKLKSFAEVETRQEILFHGIRYYGASTVP